MKIISFILLLATAGSISAAPNGVIRSAPNFSWDGIAKASSLSSVRGQAVVLLLARSPRDRAFKKQAKNLQRTYSEFASRGVIFAAAFTNDEEGVIHSNIPFVHVKNAAQVSALYDAHGFGIAIIAGDGNLDYLTNKVLPASRVHDVIQNSYGIQAGERKTI